METRTESDRNTQASGARMDASKIRSSTSSANRRARRRPARALTVPHSSNTAATNYTTSNITLPAGTYFVRNERDYSGNVNVSRSFTVNTLAVERNYYPQIRSFYKRVSTADQDNVILKKAAK